MEGIYGAKGKKIVLAEEFKNNYKENFINYHLKFEVGKKNLESNKKSFQPGDIVINQTFTKKFQIVEELKEGIIYLAIDEKYMDKNPFVPAYEIVLSHSLFLEENIKDTSFRSERRFNIYFMKTPLRTIIHNYYTEFGGYIFNPPYQRDYVWDLEDKVDLIDSIFRKIDIGKFVLIPEDEGYEVLDGKQRIKTILDFTHDKFKFKDYYYSELSVKDKLHFLNHSIALAQIQEKLSLKEKYEYFLRLNKKGRVMSKTHLKNVEEEYKAL